VPSSQRSARHDRNDVARRYHAATEQALQQLEWCIGYLRQIRKPRIAKALEDNRASIIKRYGL
jgi:hypothetical protein